MQGVWRHYKGGLYTLLFRAVSSDNRDDRNEVAVYVSHTTGQVYTRSWAEFVERLPNGRDRFVYVGPSVGPPVRS